MKISDYGRFTLGICLATASLAGCGAGSRAGVSGALPSQGVTTPKTVHRASSSSGDLLYVTTSKALVVVSYPDWGIVATVPGNYSNAFVCSDPNTGDVFVTSAAFSSSQEILEYAHGGTTPIATLNVPSGYTNVFGCSVDPTTGNLAAAATGPGYKNGAALIYQAARGTPTAYTDKHFREFASPAYDSSGDAFFAVTTQKIGFKIAELPAGKKTFTVIRLNESLSGFNLQWDGTYLVFENYQGPHLPNLLYQIKVTGNNGTVVGIEQVDHGGAPAIAILGDLFFGFDSQVEKPNNRPIAAWPYPTGGEPTSKFYGVAMGRYDDLIDLTISVAPSQ